MNAIYRIVWNAVTGRWVVASELAKGRKKTSASKRIATTVALVGMLGAVAPAFALSTNGKAPLIVNDTGFNVTDGGNCQAIAGEGTYTFVSIANCDSDSMTSGNYKNARQTDSVVVSGSSMSVGGYQYINGTDGGNALTITTSGANISMNAGKVTGLARGSADTDAVNVSQLKSVTSAMGGGMSVNADGTLRAPSITVNGTAYSDMTSAVQATATMAGNIDALNWNAAAGAFDAKHGLSATSKIVNVAAGTVGASSTDAVNGSQLYATNQNVAQNTTNITSLGSRVTTNEGNISTLNTNVSNIDARTTQNTNSISSLDGRVTNVEGSVSNLTNQINKGSVGMVQQASAGADLTVGKATDGAAVNFADQGGNARTLKNVKAGVNANDAVNMSQLDATNAAVTQNTTSISSLDQRVTTNEGDIGTINTNVSHIDARVTQNTTDIASLDKRVTTNEGDISSLTTNVSNIDARVTQNTNSISSLDGRVTNVEGGVSNLTNQINSGSVGMVQQASAGADLTVGNATDGAAVNFADKSGNARTLKSVKAGVSDSDAVNMSQLNATNAAVTQNTTDISSLDKRVTSNEGDIGTINTNVSNIDARVTQNTSSISSLDGRVTNVEGNVSNLTNQINQGELGLVKQDASSKVVTVAKDTGGKQVDMAGTEGERTVTGVAEGDVSASSKDAVNGSQLFATNQQVAQNTAAIAGNTASIAGLSQSINNITTGGNGVKFFHASSAAIDSVASGRESVAVGGGAQATASQSVALGSGSVADRDNSVSVGSQGNERQITNVKAGTADTDAVNVAQLKAAGVINGDGTANAAVTYDRNADGSANHGSVTLGNGQSASGTTIHNVAAGVGEMDAVNVAQLNAVVSQATSTSNAVASNDAGRPAAKATGEHSTAIGGGSVADRDNTVSVGSQGNERQITNVKAGTIDTDAVNVAQMNQASSSATSSANSYTDQQVGNVAKQVAGMQQQMDDQFRNVNKRISGNNAMSTSMMTMAASLGGIETQNRFGAGTGFSNGSKAISVGYQRAISKRANITVGASVTGGDSSVGVGVGMGW
jgi:autotransporter adhesin